MAARQGRLGWCAWRAAMPEAVGQCFARLTRSSTASLPTRPAAALKDLQTQDTRQSSGRAPVEASTWPSRSVVRQLMPVCAVPSSIGLIRG